MRTSVVFLTVTPFDLFLETVVGSRFLSHAETDHVELG